MKNNRTLTLVMLVALAALASIGIINGTGRVQAQDEDDGQSTSERISFGMVGITRGQTIRINVVNTDSARQGELPPDPCRVAMTFLDTQGQRFRNRDGSVVRRVVQLQPGRATSLELNADDFAAASGRIQLRALVTLPPPIGDTNALPPDPCVPTVEVINHATLQTSFVMPGESRMGRPDGGNHNETLVRDLSSRVRQ